MFDAHWDPCAAVAVVSAAGWLYSLLKAAVWLRHARYKDDVLHPTADSRKTEFDEENEDTPLLCRIFREHRHRTVVPCVEGHSVYYADRQSVHAAPDCLQGSKHEDGQ